jgi:hypothetical protein
MAASKVQTTELKPLANDPVVSSLVVHFCAGLLDRYQDPLLAPTFNPIERWLRKE